MKTDSKTAPLKTVLALTGVGNASQLKKILSISNALPFEWAKNGAVPIEYLNLAKQVNQQLSMCATAVSSVSLSDTEIAKAIGMSETRYALMLDGLKVSKIEHGGDNIEWIETLRKINVDNNEIAKALGITPRSVTVMKNTRPETLLLLKDGFRIKKVRNLCGVVEVNDENQ